MGKDEKKGRAERINQRNDAEVCGIDRVEDMKSQGGWERKR